MRKTVLLVSSILFFLILVSAGYLLVSGALRVNGTGPAIGSRTVNLEYWGIIESEQVMRPVINKYKTRNPNVNITYIQRSFGDDLGRYKDTLYNRLRAGQGPGIFRIHSTWAPKYVSELAPANNVITNAEISANFYPIAKNQCTTTDWKVLCVPIMYDGLVLLYNREMFLGAGVNEPRTWQDLKDAAQRLTIRDSENRIVRAGIAVGTSNNVRNSSDILGLMLVQSGVAIPDGLDSANAQSAVKFYTDFVKVDRVWDSTQPDSNVAFATQNVAMTFAKSSDILEILELNPTLDIGVLGVPQLPAVNGGLTQDGWASFWVEAVSADLSEPEQQEAWKFLKWLSEPEQQKMIYSEASKYSKFGPAYSISALSADLSENPYLGPMVEQAPYAKTSIISSYSGNDEFVGIINTAINSIITGDRRGSDPASVMKKAKEDFVAAQK